MLDSIAAHGHGFRYYEFFSSEADLEAFIYEAQVLGLPVQAHAESMHRTPDFAELASFLIGAGDYSYFSFSYGWTFSDFPWLPEYDAPLGKPLGAPVKTNRTTPVEPWATLNNTNLVCGLIPAPRSSGAAYAFLGEPASAAECAAAARANASFAAWTWVGASGGDWAKQCYGRLDTPPADCVSGGGGGGGCSAPCFTSAQADTYSALSYATNITSTLYTRDFEHLHVEFEPASYAARMTPR